MIPFNRFRKKIITLSLLLLATLTFCTGCGGKKKENVSVDSLTVFTHMAGVLEDPSEFYFFFPDNTGYKEYLNYTYHLTPDQITSASFCFSENASADEVLVLESKDPSSLKSCLKQHLTERKTDFTGYAPKEEEKISNAVILQKGQYLVLVVGSSKDQIQETFDQCFASDFHLSGKEKKFQQDFLAAAKEGKTLSDKDRDQEQELIKEVPGEIPEYDTSKIIEAYKNKDASLLTDSHDQEILKACQNIIASIITPDMSDYDKELALHDYLIRWCTYDEKALSNYGYYTKYSDGPYGLLIHKQAICIGYASTFKLLMDLVDVKCLIVKGTADANEHANHAWNKVKLSDGWYNVDLTWDDPVDDAGADSPIVGYSYFNVSDDYMTQTEHYWNPAHYPASSGTKYAYHGK